MTTQAEYATDLVFKSPQHLAGFFPRLLEPSTLCFSARDVLSFLGRHRVGLDPQRPGGRRRIGDGGRSLADAGSPGAERHWDLYELAEELVDLEDFFRQWRFRHVTTVARIIGFKPGEGDTARVAYLRTPLDVRLFPELWDLRTSL